MGIETGAGEGNGTQETVQNDGNSGLGGVLGSGLSTSDAVDSIAEGLGLGAGNGDESSTEADPAAAEAKPAAAESKPDPSAVAPDPTADAAAKLGAAAPGALAVPKTWRPEAAAKWATVDPTVQAEILKREEDVFRGISQYKQAADYGANVQRAISPYLPAMQQHGIEPIAHIQTLMNAHQTLALGTQEAKEAMFLELARDYGVDLGRLDPVNRPYEDPQVASLQQTVRRLESQLNGITTQSAQTKQSELSKQVQEFADNVTEHPHFNDVFEDMAVLLQGAPSLSLKDAYDKAVWANPATRAKELLRIDTDRKAQAERDAEAARAAAAAKTAAARKATGANVRTVPKSGSASAPVGSIEDTLAETLKKIEARAG